MGSIEDFSWAGSQRMLVGEVAAVRAREHALQARMTAVTPRIGLPDDQVTSLVEVNQALRASSDRLESDSLDQFLETIVRHAVEISGASAGSLALSSTDETHLEVVGALQRDLAGSHLVAIPTVERLVPLTGFGRDIWEDIKRAVELLWQPLDDPRVPETMRRWYESRGYKDALLVPIRLAGSTYGHLALIFGAQGRPSGATLQVARVLAQQTAVAIRMKHLGESARQAAIARERAAQLDAANEALRRTIERTAADESGSGALDSLLEEAACLVGASGGLIGAIDPTPGKPFRPVAATLRGQRLSIDDWLEVAGFDVDPSLADPDDRLARIRQGEEVITRLDTRTLTWPGGARAFLPRIAVCQRVALPIRSRGSVVGLLELWLPHRDPPAPELLAQLRTFALQAALSLEMLRFREATSKSATEAERARIAGEIHDGLAQAFLAIMMQSRAARISDTLRKRDMPRFLERIESMAVEGLEEARRSVFALRSISVESDGLVAALERLVGNLSIAGRTQCVLVNRVAELAVSPCVEDAVYRIVQEATQNALKHAGACEVKVELDTIDGQLRVSVEDDGTGLQGDVIQGARERGGLRAMRDRAERCGGSFCVESRACPGTRVSVMFPTRSTS